MPTARGPHHAGRTPSRRPARCGAPPVLPVALPPPAGTPAAPSRRGWPPAGRSRQGSLWRMAGADAPDAASGDRSVRRPSRRAAATAATPHRRVAAPLRSHGGGSGPTHERREAKDGCIEPPGAVLPTPGWFSTIPGWPFGGVAEGRVGGAAAAVVACLQEGVGELSGGDDETMSTRAQRDRVGCGRVRQVGDGRRSLGVAFKKGGDRG